MGKRQDRRRGFQHFRQLAQGFLGQTPGCTGVQRLIGIGFITDTTDRREAVLEGSTKFFGAFETFLTTNNYS
jgi:hypothetical protein